MKGETSNMQKGPSFRATPEVIKQIKAPSKARPLDNRAVSILWQGPILLKQPYLQPIREIRVAAVRTMRPPPQSPEPSMACLPMRPLKR